MKKRIFSFILTLCITFGIMLAVITPVHASVPSGTYEVPNTGGSIHFTVSGNTLTVSGTGAIPDRTLETAGNILGTAYVTGTAGATITKIVVESGITRFGNFAFAGFNNVTEITIPESVTTIGMYAFWGMGITSLQLPSSLSIIDTLAIIDCPSLTTITFGNDSTDTALTTARYRFVADCPNVNLIRFSPSMSSILPGALSDVANNSGLIVEAYMKFRGAVGYNTEGLIGLPDGVLKDYYELAVQKNGTAVNVSPTKNTSALYAGYYAAGDTVNFTVTPNPGYTLMPVSSYMKGALSPSSGTTYSLTMASHEDCIMATGINPGASGTEVASGTMPNNSNITWQVIQVDGGYKLCFSGSGELSVGDDPPWKATYKDSILSVEMGEGITKISTASIVGGGAFYNYANLKEVSFPSSLTEIGGKAFNLTDALENVTLSSGVKTVGAYAFNNCYKIKKVTLNEGLTNIGEGAFPHAFLDASVSSATVIIPPTVTSIGNNAFPNSGKLTVYNCSSASLDLAHPTVYSCVTLTTTVTGGSVTLSAPASGYKNYYYYGNDIGSSAETVTITAPSGKMITSIKRGGTELLVDGTEVTSYTYTVVNGSNSLDITLEATPRNITYSAASGGTISGMATARAGDIVTVTVIPESGFSCTGIYLKTGSSALDIAVSGNSFEMPDDDVTISATFAAKLRLTGTLSASGTCGQALSTLIPTLTENSKVETESGTVVAGTWSFDTIQSLGGQSTASNSILPAVGGTTGYTVTFTPSANPENYANTLTATVVPEMSYLSTDAEAAPEGMKAVVSDWYISDVTLNAPDGFSIASSIDGACGVSLTVSSDMDGSYTYYLKEDTTGYFTDAKTIALRRDVTTPVIGMLAYSEHISFLDWLFHNESITITVPVTDATSGAKKISYVLIPDGGSAQEAQTTDVDSSGSATFTIPKIFKGTVAVTAYDIAGNASAAYTTKKLMVEDTAPTMTITDGTNAFTENWYTTTQTMYITLSDEGSGLKAVTYTVDGNSSQTIFEASSGDGSLTTVKDLILTAQEGTHIYSVTVTDNALNATTTAVTIKQDSMKPTISIVEASHVTQETATVTVTAADAASGVTSYTLTCTTGGLTDQSNATGIFKLTGLQPYTNYAFTATVTDNAGNVSIGSGVSFKTEKSVPTITTEPSFASAVYGTSLSKLIINQGVSDVTGTWALDETGAEDIYPLVGGTTTYTVKFVPADNAFDTLTREITPVITPKTLSVTGATAAGRKYDGMKQVSITAVMLDGLINSDDVSVDISNLTGTISSADAGTYNSVTLPAMTLTGTAADNYTLTQPAAAVPTSVIIEKANALRLTCTATMVKNQASYTVELDLTKVSGFPSNHGGTPAYDVVSSDPYNGLTSATSNSSGKLTLAADNTTNSIPDTVTVSVTSMGNYADSTITVTVNYKDKAPAEITGMTTTTSTLTVSVASDSGQISAAASVSGTIATVSVTDAQLKEIVSGTETGTIKINLSDLKVDTVVVPAKFVSASSVLVVVLPAGTVTLNKEAQASVVNKGVIMISVISVDNSGLSDTQKAALGTQADTALVVDVNIYAGGVKVSTFGNGKIEVSVPYTLKTGENAGSITVWFMKDDGTIEPKNGTYSNGKVEFTTDHLSQYLIVSFPFKDVAENSWYYGSVAYAYNNTLFAGTSDTTFSPYTAMTRQMIWMVLARMDGKTPANMDEARIWAVENGISDGSNPTSSITREQMAAILYRYSQYKKYYIKQDVMTILEFADYDSISEYALPALTWAVNTGLMKGSANHIMPSDTATRAQVVTILQRFYQNVAK